MLTVHLGVGMTAAILTACEYVLSSLSALSLHAALRGLWLQSLHRIGQKSLLSAHGGRRAVLRDLLTCALSLWLVISVALVESNLQSHVTAAPSNTAPMPFDSCMRLDRAGLSPNLVRTMKPSLKFSVPQWAKDTVLYCPALVSVPVDGDGKYAPACATAGVPLTNVTVHVSELHVEHDRVAAMPGKSALVEFFVSGVAAGVVRVPNSVGNSTFREPRSGACYDVGVSALRTDTDLDADWIAMATNSSELAQGVHQLLCAEAGNQALPAVYSNASVFTSCVPVDAPSQRKFSPACVAGSAAASELGRVTLRNVTTLFLGERDNASYACFGATITIDYLLMAPELLSQLNPRANATLPVRVPFRYAVITGHCERTVHVLARAALVYALDLVEKQHLNGDDDSKGILYWYHAFLVSVSDAQFPLGEYGNAGTQGDCALRDVYHVTGVPADWRLFMLAAGLAVTVAVIVTGALVRVCYRGVVWRVGSLAWSLRELQKTQSVADFRIIVERGGSASSHNRPSYQGKSIPGTSGDSDATAAMIKKSLSLGRSADSESPCSYRLMTVPSNTVVSGLSSTTNNSNNSSSSSDSKSSVGRASDDGDPPWMTMDE